MKEANLYSAKICPKCKVAKLAADFGRHEGTKDGLQSWCRACVNLYATEWRKQNDTGQRKYPELRVRGIGTYTKEALRNIAKHKGIDFDIFMKAELAEIIQRHPEHMRKPLSE